jgi:tRNA(fMet)-specific endonuclease VapC
VIVLDTDVISELMRPEPPRGLLGRLRQVPAAEQATTAITIGELRYGSERVGRPDLYERAMALLAAVPVLAFERSAADHYGRVRAALERRGERLADPDLRIASTVLAHQATLISGNVRHFQRIAGLQVEDWLWA